MNNSKKIIITIFLIIILIAIDQIIKLAIPKESTQVIEGFLKMTYTENTGGAFGIASDNIIAIILINVIVLGIAIRFLISQFDKIDKLTKVFTCFIIAGGASNFLDRIIKGFVIDYIDIGQLIPYPVFNLADILIVIGWIGLVIFTIKAMTKGMKK